MIVIMVVITGEASVIMDKLITLMNKAQCILLKMLEVERIGY